MLPKPRLQERLLMRANVDANVDLFQRQFQLALGRRNPVLGEELSYFITPACIAEDAGVLYHGSIGIVAEFSFDLGPVLADEIPSNLAPSGVFHHRTDHLGRILRPHDGGDCEIKSARQQGGIAEEAQHLAVQEKFVLSLYLGEVSQNSVVERSIAFSCCNA